MSTGASGPAGTPFPLSPTQLGIWLTEQLVPGTSAYINPLGLRLSGAVEPERARDALVALHHRHPMLRAQVIDVDGEPWQVVTDAPPPEVPVIADTSEEAVVAEMLAPFDVERAPLWRATLVAEDESACSLYLCLHHLVSDGCSLGILFREFVELYVVGDAALPPVPGIPSFADLVAAQRARDLTALRAYWAADQAGVARGVDLPVLADATRVSTGRYDNLFVGADRIAAVRRATATGCSTFALLFACFVTALHRTTRARDLSVLTPLSDRLAPGADAVVGCLLDTVPIRTRIGDRDTVTDVARRLTASIASAMSHQMSLLEIAAAVDESGPGPRPEYNVMFLENNAPSTGVTRGGVTFTPFEIGRIDVKHDLAVAVSVDARGVRIRTEEATPRVPRAVSGAVMAELLTCVDEITTDPDTLVVRR